MSTLALESDLLAKDGHVLVSVSCVVATLVAGVTAAALGLAIGRPNGESR
jgi:fluoride ion exporter CrcB/FEX